MTIQHIHTELQDCVLIDDLQVDYVVQQDGSLYDLNMDIVHSNMETLIAYYTED